MFKFIKCILVFIIILAVVTGGFSLWLSDKYVVPIMMYHSVNYSDKYISNVTDPKIFASHMKFLKDNGYNVISLDELVEATLKKESLSLKSVVITFDDGLEDNYSHAFGILRHHGFPATVFTATVTLNTEGYLSLKQINEMYTHGITMGSHGLTQGYLPGLSERERQQQIINSKKILQAKLRQPIDYISYPTGGFSEEIKDIVRQAGYKGACTTNRGYDRLNKDVYELKRIRFGNKDNSHWILRAKLSGFYNFFRSAKAPY